MTTPERIWLQNIRPSIGAGVFALNGVGVEYVRADLIAPLPDAPAPGSGPGAGSTEEDAATLREAQSLAQWLWREHYADVAPQWGVLDTTRGALSQIDNMLAGLRERHIADRQNAVAVAIAIKEAEARSMPTRVPDAPAPGGEGVREAFRAGFVAGHCVAAPNGWPNDEDEARAFAIAYPATPSPTEEPDHGDR